MQCHSEDQATPLPIKALALHRLSLLVWCSLVLQAQGGLCTHTNTKTNELNAQADAQEVSVQRCTEGKPIAGLLALRTSA